MSMKVGHPYQLMGTKKITCSCSLSKRKEKGFAVRLWAIVWDPSQIKSSQETSTDENEQRISYQKKWMAINIGFRGSICHHASPSPKNFYLICPWKGRSVFLLFFSIVISQIFFLTNILNIRSGRLSRLLHV